jgi:hypothetical protein
VSALMFLHRVLLLLSSGYGAEGFSSGASGKSTGSPASILRRRIASGVRSAGWKSFLKGLLS